MQPDLGRRRNVLSARLVLIDKAPGGEAGENGRAQEGGLFMLALLVAPKR